MNTPLYTTTGREYPSDYCLATAGAYAPCMLNPGHNGPHYEANGHAFDIVDGMAEAARTVDVIPNAPLEADSSLILETSTPSRILQTAKWETKRGGQTKMHTATLEIFYFSQFDFEYIVRYESVKLSSSNGRTVRETIDSVASFPSMKRAAADFNFTLENNKGPEANKVSY
jgi:hypothetical protein